MNVFKLNACLLCLTNLEDKPAESSFPSFLLTSSPS